MNMQKKNTSALPAFGRDLRVTGVWEPAVRVPDTRGLWRVSSARALLYLSPLSNATPKNLSPPPPRPTQMPHPSFSPCHYLLISALGLEQRDIWKWLPASSGGPLRKKKVLQHLSTRIKDISVYPPKLPLFPPSIYIELISTAKTSHT